MSRLHKLFACALTCVVWSTAHSADQEGTCDPGVERVKKTIRFRVGTISEDAESVSGAKVCEKKETRIRKCAVLEHRKSEAQFFCYPEDGSEQHAEHYEVIEYYEAKHQ